MTYTMAENETVGNIIKKLREQRGLSQRKLGELAGVDRGYINQLENRGGSITLKIAQKLANAFEVDADVFFGAVAQPPREESLGELLSKATAISKKLQEVEFVPYIGCIPCGLPELEEESSTEEYVPVSKEALKGAKRVFAVTVSGDSMTGDGIESGDTLIFDRDGLLVPGKIYAVRLDDGTVTAKHVVRIDGQVLLRASNAAYQDIPVTRGQIMGRLIAAEKRF